MVLAELGTRISSAIRSMNDVTILDAETFEKCMKEVCAALLQADVNVKLVMKLRENVRKQCIRDGELQGANKRRLIQQSIVKELTGLLDPGTKPFELKKGRTGGNVVMFVGLQGCGKTTSCTKFAYSYQKKGWKVGLVCADTFRAGAFDQLKQNATKAKVPFYGSYTETDPSRIAADGVERFKKENFDLIIVDTSGRHKQEESLFEEMRMVDLAVSPDLTIFTMDSSIGQAAHDQAKAFKDAVDVGAVIVTKMDGHAKGGGALSAVAATESPIIFIGTGEHIDEFEAFEARSFVSRLLGMGDLGGLMGKVQEIIPEGQEEELLEKLTSGTFTLRLMYEQFQNIMSMGPLSQVISMIPGVRQEMMPQGHEAASQAKFKRYMTIMDSMTDAELDAPKGIIETSRMKRLAIGSGRRMEDILELIAEYTRLSKAWGKMGKLKIPKKGDMNALMRNQNAAQMGKMLAQCNPQMFKQMGGVGGLQNMMKQMQNMEKDGGGGLASMLGS